VACLEEDLNGENKAKRSYASVDDYIASRANAQQPADCRELMAQPTSYTLYPTQPLDKST
jgi:hypothetical protein